VEPRIQYAKTSDGVCIAYGVFGERTPLIYTPRAYGIGVHYYSHLSYSRRSVDQLTGAGFQVVRYDGRGTGSRETIRPWTSNSKPVPRIRSGVPRSI